MRKQSRGFSIAEALVVFSVFGLLLASLFYVYSMGANAWMKSDTDSELLGEAQAFSGRITREAERSSFLSLTVNHPEPIGVSFLSPVDEAGQFQYDTYTKRPIWQKYLIFYRDQGSGQILEAERPVLGTSAQSVPLRLPSQALQDDLTSHFGGGRALVGKSRSLEFRVHPLLPEERLGRNERLEVVLKLDKDVRGQADVRTLELRTFVRFRN